MKWLIWIRCVYVCLYLTVHCLWRIMCASNDRNRLISAAPFELEYFYVFCVCVCFFLFIVYKLAVNVCTVCLVSCYCCWCSFRHCLLSLFHCWVPMFIASMYRYFSSCFIVIVWLPLLFFQTNQMHFIDESHWKRRQNNYLIVLNVLLRHFLVFFLSICFHFSSSLLSFHSPSFVSVSVVVVVFCVREGFICKCYVLPNLSKENSPSREMAIHEKIKQRKPK